MKLFWRIFATVIVSVIVIVSLISYLLSAKHIAAANDHLLANYRTVSRFMSKEIELGHSEQRWPLASLHWLSKGKGFLFWWVVRADGTIHLADKASFMDTDIHDYFPQAANATRHKDVLLRPHEHYAIFIEPLDLREKNWSFWLGVSLKELSRIRKNVVMMAIAFSVAALLITGIILYLAVRYFTRPLEHLTTAATAIGSGDFTHKVEIQSDDEVGQLAHSFNTMAKNLQKTTVSKHFMDNIIETMVDPLIVVGPDAKIKTTNKAASKTLGYTNEELLNKRFESIFAATETMSIEGENLEKTIGNSALKNYETKFQTKDGNQIPIILSSSVMKDSDDNILCMVCTAKDITDRKHAEDERETLIAELEDKNIELERFAYTVSHDLKSPLITIKGFLGILEEDAAKGDGERMKADITRIANAADQMKALLDDLLELSRIGRFVGIAGEFSMTDLAHQAVELHSVKIAEGALQVAVSPDLPVVSGDRSRLLQIVQNLLDNAVKFMGDQPNPQVEIGVRQDGKETVCYVRDNGVGIDPRHHEKVFGLFNKLDQKTQGTGVGLAIVKQIVQVHGGRIWVESEGAGRGSTFCFTLPTSKNCNSTKEPENEQDTSGYLVS